MQSLKYTFGDITPKSGSVQTYVSGKYDMDKKTHGLALIINNQCFKDSRFPTREGSDNDAKDLETLFCHLGYDVQVHRDRTSKEMVSLFTKIGLSTNHSNYDSFVCCILSYGDDGNKIFGSDGEIVDLSNLAKWVKGDICKSLAGKPKMFFIEASRGKKEVPPAAVADDEAEVPKTLTYYIPDTADFIFCYATRDGFEAYRRVGSTANRKGAYYIMEVCRVLTEYSSFTPLIDMMHIVHENVGTKYRSRKGVPLEAPEMTSRLRKHVFFHNSA